jgi:hypothetical protein
MSGTAGQPARAQAEVWRASDILVASSNRAGGPPGQAGCHHGMCCMMQCAPAGNRLEPHDSARAVGTSSTVNTRRHRERRCLFMGDRAVSSGDVLPTSVQSARRHALAAVQGCVAGPALAPVPLPAMLPQHRHTTAIVQGRKQLRRGRHNGCPLARHKHTALHSRCGAARIPSGDNGTRSETRSSSCFSSSASLRCVAVLARAAAAVVSTVLSRCRERRRSPQAQKRGDIVFGPRPLRCRFSRAVSVSQPGCRSLGDCNNAGGGPSSLVGPRAHCVQQRLGPRQPLTEHAPPYCNLASCLS